MPPSRRSRIGNPSLKSGLFVAGVSAMNLPPELFDTVVDRSCRLCYLFRTTGESSVLACVFHPWKREKSPAFHASRSPGVPQIPVRANFTRHGAQIVPKIDDRWTAPEPVAIIDAVDHEARLEYEHMRDHRIVIGVGVLLDFEILLNRSVGGGKEGPLRSTDARNC
jgi:hypothetical protein